MCVPSVHHAPSVRPCAQPCAEPSRGRRSLAATHFPRHSQPTCSPLAAVTRPVTRPVTRTLRHSHAPSIVKSDEQAGENVFMKGATLSACDRVSAKPIRLVSFELVGPG